MAKLDTVYRGRPRATVLTTIDYMNKLAAWLALGKLGVSLKVPGPVEPPARVKSLKGATVGLLMGVVQKGGKGSRWQTHAYDHKSGGGLTTLKGPYEGWPIFVIHGHPALGGPHYVRLSATQGVVLCDPFGVRFPTSQPPILPEKPRRLEETVTTRVHTPGKRPKRHVRVLPASPSEECDAWDCWENRLLIMAHEILRSINGTLDLDAGCEGDDPPPPR